MRILSLKSTLLLIQKSILALLVVLNYRYHRMTNRLAFFICQELTKLTSLTSVAKVANVSVSTVIRIFNHINYGTPTLPKVLCIDEFKGNTETGKYQCRELAK
jgi:transposase